MRLSDFYAAYEETSPTSAAKLEIVRFESPVASRRAWYMRIAPRPGFLWQRHHCAPVTTRYYVR